MFRINAYRYIDIASKAKFIIYARTLETAEKIAKAINSLSVYKIRKKRFRFTKPMFTEIPPYELESLQFESVEEMREKMVSKDE